MEKCHFVLSLSVFCPFFKQGLQPLGETLFSKDIFHGEVTYGFSCRTLHRCDTSRFLIRPRSGSVILSNSFTINYIAYSELGARGFDALAGSSPRCAIFVSDKIDRGITPSIYPPAPPPGTSRSVTPRFISIAGPCY